MTIKRLESLVFGVEDVAQCTGFLEQWGLEKVESGKSGATFRTIENQPIILRRADDTSLPPSDEAGSTCREAIWGVENLKTLTAIGAELSRDRDVKADDDGTLHARDESGYAIGFRLAAIETANVAPPRYNYHDQINRLNADGWPDDHPKPIRLGHVVFGIPAKDNRAAADFYIDRLNFRMSDRAEDAGTFMRCDGSRFHHCLLLYHRGDHKRYNHCAFEVAHIDDLMVAGGHISAQGWETESGPGRHSLGSNVFWYFHSPLGGSIEYFADMDRLDDAWEPRHWETAPPYSRWMIGDAHLRT